MNWSIEDDHYLKGEPEINRRYTATKKYSNKKKKVIEVGEFNPPERLDTIVIHYTRGSSGSSSANWLSREKVEASAHLVIDRSGEVFQLAPFNVKTWHAGDSELNGRKWFNNFSIGIELDNAGPLKKVGNRYIAKFNKEYNEDEAMLAQHQNETSPRYWHKYTVAQIEACELVCLELIAKYNIKFIYGHDEIAPGRKSDPGPLFQMDEFRSQLLGGGRSDEPDFEAFEGVVEASKLNIRQGPGGSNPLVSMPLPKGKEVEVLRQSGDWYEVETKIKGWVSSKFINKKG